MTVRSFKTEKTLEKIISVSSKVAFLGFVLAYVGTQIVAPAIANRIDPNAKSSAPEYTQLFSDNDFSTRFASEDWNSTASRDKAGWQAISDKYQLGFDVSDEAVSVLNDLVKEKGGIQNVAYPELTWDTESRVYKAWSGERTEAGDLIHADKTMTLRSDGAGGISLKASSGVR